MDKFSRRDFLSRTGLALAAGGLAGPAFSQSDRPLRLVVGYAAGGATDVLARQLADRLRTLNPEGAIVENKPGANGLLAVAQVKGSAADGNTLLFAPDFAFTIFPHSYRKLPFDPDDDFVPVALVGRIPLVFVVGPAVPQNVRTLADFAQWCQAHRDKAAFGSSGLGGGFHFIGVRMNRALGVEMTHVPYRGGAPLVQDLVAGQLPASPVAIGAAQPFLASGKMRVLASFSPTRSPLLPDVPTMVELGYPDFVVEQWAGMFAPARTPAATVARLNRMVGEVTRSPDFAQAVSKLGYETWSNSPEQFAQRIRSERDRWGPIVRASGYVAEE